MRARRRRPLAALAAGAVTAGSVLLFAPSAEACSCASRRSLEEALADGDVIALLSRVDTDPKAHTVRLRVERTLDGTLPAEVTGKIGYPEGCDYTVGPGQITARLVERRETGWQVAYCQYLDIGDTLQKMAGDPAATSRRPAVLLAAGAFEGARLATLDSAGDVVAWDGLPGHALAAATCPGAGTVVAVGRRATTRGEPGERLPRPVELTVHDAASLEVRRTVDLPLGEEDQVSGLRCRDAQGERVDMVVAVNSVEDGSLSGSLLNVDGRKVETRHLDAVTGAVATSDGFLAVQGAHPGASIIRLGQDGSRRVLAQLPKGAREWGGLVLSPDGKTVAVGAYIRGTGVPSTVTVDVASGTVLADRTRPFDENPAVWAGPDRLLLWRPPSYDEAGRIRMVDRRLRTVDTVPATSGYSLTAVDGRPVTYGDWARVTAYPASGPPRVVDELRLVGTQVLVPLAALADHPFAPPVGLLPPKGETESHSTSWNIVPIALAGGAVAVLGLAFFRRRRTKVAG